MILIKATKQAKNKLLWLSIYTLWLKTAIMIQKVQKHGICKLENQNNKLKEGKRIHRIVAHY